MQRIATSPSVLPLAGVRIYVFIITALLCYAAVVLHQFFPVMYTWEELFINYEGGFTRRGLLGQAFFLLDRILPVSIGYLVLYTVLFYAFLYVSYKKMRHTFDPVLVAFLFISPVIFLLPVTDRYVFGRKDLFIEVLVLCMAHVCMRCLTQKDTSLYKNTLLLGILFITGMLIHEMMLFYCPLFAVLLGVCYARREKTLQWLFITGITFAAVVLVFAVLFIGDTDTRDAICTSWRQYYPDLTCKRALRFIGNLSVHEVLVAFQYHTNPVTLGSVCLGAFLGGLPLLAIWKAYRPFEAIRSLLAPSPVLRFAIWPAALAPLIVLMLNIDYGRYISAAYLTYLFFLYVVLSACPQAAAPWLDKCKAALAASPRLRYAAYGFAIAYGLFWRMSHNEPIGESLIIPGVLFHLQ